MNCYKKLLKKIWTLIQILYLTHLLCIFICKRTYTHMWRHFSVVLCEEERTFTHLGGAGDGNWANRNLRSGCVRRNKEALKKRKGEKKKRLTSVDGPHLLHVGLLTFSNSLNVPSAPAPTPHHLLPDPPWPRDYFHTASRSCCSVASLISVPLLRQPWHPAALSSVPLRHGEAVLSPAEEPFYEGRNHCRLSQLLNLTSTAHNVRFLNSLTPLSSCNHLALGTHAQASARRHTHTHKEKEKDSKVFFCVLFLKQFYLRVVLVEEL